MCSAQLMNNRCNNNQGRAEVIITSFVRVVYSLKYPSNACLSCLDNCACCWNANQIISFETQIHHIRDEIKQHIINLLTKRLSIPI